MNKIHFIIGASGSGKTTVVKNLEKTNPLDFNFCYFDSIGVPSPEEMIEKFGGGEGWQNATTKIWVKKIKDEFWNTGNTILDGQIRPSFIVEACKENGVESYDVILFDCTDEVRKERLHKRGQPDLASEQMMNWAKYLREDSQKRAYAIVDTTNQTPEESLESLRALLQ